MSPKLTRTIVFEDHNSIGLQENPLSFEVEDFGSNKSFRTTLGIMHIKQFIGKFEIFSYNTSS